MLAACGNGRGESMKRQSSRPVVAILAFVAAMALAFGTGAAFAQETAPKASSGGKNAAGKKEKSRQSAAKPQPAPAPTESETKSTGSNAQGFPTIETEARNVFIIDYATDTVLFEKAPDERVGPASMSKIMT